MKTRAAVAFEARNPMELVELELEGPTTGEVLVEMATEIRHADGYTLDGFDSLDGIGKGFGVMHAGQGIHSVVVF